MSKFTLRLAAGFLLVVGLLLGSVPAFALTGASVSSALSSPSIQPGGKVTVTVTVTNPNNALLGVIGNFTTLPSGVTFASPNNLSSNCPASASPNPDFGGNNLQITGSSFGPTTFQLAANASCTYQVDVTAPSVGTFSVFTNYANTTIFPANTSLSGTNSTSVSLLVGTPPVVTSISPTNGPTTGGTTVIISGSSFDATAANDIVKFGTTSANVTAASTTSLTVTSPVVSAGPVDITVSTSGGTSVTSSADVFTYLAPTVVCPTQTKTMTIGGASLTTTNLITTCNDSSGYGLFLSSGDVATQAGNPSNELTIDCSSIYSPACDGTPQTITTTNATYAFVWDYINNSADTYTITLISVGHNASPNVTSSANLSGLAGTDSFTLYTADAIFGPHPVPFAFTIPAIPTVTSLSPTSGPVTGGTSVVITGANFTGTTGASGVKFGATNATSYTVNSATQITATAPAGTGVVDVTVTNGGSTSATSAADQFTYLVLTMTAQPGTTPQSATIDTAFTNNLSVLVKDASNNTISGVNVTFTAPGSGDSGTFSNSTNTITVATNAFGVAFEPFTANATAGGPYNVTAAASGVTTVNFSMTNTPGAPSIMTANAGTTPQSATISTAFTNALGVTVKDASSNPVPGINVTFTAPGSGDSGTFSNSTNTITVATDASGIASAPFTANTTAGGPYTVTAAASGVATVNFSMTNTPGAPSIMTANAGTTPQSATISTAFTNALGVTVKDASNNTISGVNVTFTAPGSGDSGTFSNSTNTITVATDASGIASAPFTANTTAGGPYNVTAAASGVTTVNFSMTNTPGAPSIMTANAGTTPQSATISTAFTNALGVTVKDASSNPVPGINVTFTAPGSGDSGTFSNSTNTITVATDASGIASAPFTANTTAGGPYTVTAAASGVATVNFSMTNTPGAPSIMTANAGTTPQSATISTAFTNALGVTVKDASNNTISGVNVTFTAPGSGDSGTFSNSTNTITVATDASGIASAPFTANTTAGGPYNVTAAASGLTTVNFSMTNTPGAPSIMTANAGTTPQSATINTAFTTALAVTVKDVGNNLLSGVNVTFTAPGSGDSGTFSNSTNTITVATDASGIASAPFTANANAGGPYTVTAAAAGVATVNFSMTNTPITMTANAGTTPQSATFSTAFTNALGVTVKDVGNNPIFGVNVTFTAPGSGASGTFSNATATITVATNASGIASAPFSANATVGGPYTVTAAASGVATVNFSMTNSQAAQTLSFTSTAPNPATALGATYTPVAVTTAPALENLHVAITVDAASSTVCSINGAGVVSFLISGTCKLDANQAGDANYLPATQVQQSITVVKAAQTISFTSTPPAVVAAGGAAYTVAATATSGLAVTFMIDGTSGAGVCGMTGLATVSFLKSGTCIVDANQAGNGSYAPAVQVQQTILVQNGVGPTVAAIAGFLSDRNNAIVTNMWNMDSTIDRLNDAPGGGGPGTGLADQPAGQPQTPLRSGLLANQNSSQSGTVIPALTSPASGAGMQDFLGLQQMVYGALRQLGETQGVNQLNYSGPFSAQMSTSGDMTGTFHTSLSQIMKWNDQVQQKEAASMGLNTSGAAGAHQFNPLDVWMQGTYAAINSTQQAKFGLISSGVDYVFNRNLLLGFYGQVDFMNQTTGLQAGGTGWLVGPYGTMRLTDQIFLEARAGYGHSANAMTDALDPILTDQFGSTRWLASAALAGRWNFGDHVGFKPNLSFTYFTDTTDAYVNGLSVAIPSVTSQLGQLKFSPEVTKGFSLGDANWYEASIAPELIYNFTSTTADGLGAVDPTATGPQGLRGAIKWGVSMKTPSGLTISTQGSYDGIGANGYSAITGEARVNVPLN